MPFDEVVEGALYDDGGFYASGGGAGRRADFITSPEVGPLFGALVARALDEEWARLGEPDPFVVVEGGAGRGTLAAAVVAASLSCKAALRYVCVERSDVLRTMAQDRLPAEPAVNVFGPSVHDVDLGLRPVEGIGPVVTVIDDLPTGPLTGVVVANELLDNLAFRLLERHDHGWSEVRVTAEGKRLVEVLVDAPPDVATDAELLAPAARTGARIPLQGRAGAWLVRALELLERGRVVVVDYADSSPSMAARPWPEWVRTYRGQGRAGAPLEALGTADITCEVAVDQLARIRPLDSDRSQAEWLSALGIDALVAEARATWHERSAVADLEAMKARSRVSEAEALLDPTGLGAFRVLEWIVP